MSDSFLANARDFSSHSSAAPGHDVRNARLLEVIMSEELSIKRETVAELPHGLSNLCRNRMAAYLDSAQARFSF